MILRIPCAYVQNLLKWHRAYTFIYICNFYVFAGVLSGRDPKQTKGQYFAARPAACISLGEFGPKKVQDIWIYDLSKKWEVDAKNREHLRYGIYIHNVNQILPV